MAYPFKGLFQYPITVLRLGGGSNGDGWGGVKWLCDGVILGVCGLVGDGVVGARCCGWNGGLWKGDAGFGVGVGAGDSFD